MDNGSVRWQYVPGANVGLAAYNKAQLGQNPWPVLGEPKVEGSTQAPAHISKSWSPHKPCARPNQRPGFAPELFPGTQGVPKAKHRFLLTSERGSG